MTVLLPHSQQPLEKAVGIETRLTVDLDQRLQNSPRDNGVAIRTGKKASNLAGEPIIAKLSRAPGNNAPIGGLKVVTRSGWAGSQRARQAPKPSTRSTPKASRTSNTCRRS
ncbi:MAG TPA: hypothetical protein VNZ53_06020 [Steroidobacteraceae bacterium]|nr:hypothetical protein [Steroidobacteraceae bacterium]